ncbi:MAG TPA: peptidase S41, partial [Bacteroidales bacterium]|nr:peptidase S41 [Bacteroidales bacterium]
PVGTELPNGWQAHYAGSQILSVSGICYELGLPPDVQVNMTREDADNGYDSIIEKACEIILD